MMKILIAMENLNARLLLLLMDVKEANEVRKLKFSVNSVNSNNNRFHLHPPNISSSNILKQHKKVINVISPKMD